VFVTHRVVLSHYSQPPNLNGYILSVTNRRHEHFGPLLGRPSLMLLDNLVAAQREKYGGQSVLELLRWPCEWGGWFHPSTREFVSIADTTVYYVTFHTASAAL
jgi:hypothetical protein